MYADLLYSPPGTKVTFLNKNGYDSDRKYANEAGLIEGQSYTLTHVDIHSYHSYVSLAEVKVKGKTFNSVMFSCEYDELYTEWIDAFAQRYE